MRLLAGSMVLSNVNEHLSNVDEHLRNVDEPKMFMVLYVICGHRLSAVRLVLK